MFSMTIIIVSIIIIITITIIITIRRRHPGHPIFRTHVIWGQGAAWQDRIQTAWLSQKTAQEFSAMERGETWDPTAPDAPNTSQAVLSWDCLEAQWSETTLYQCWKHQQMTMPNLPDHTGASQGPDTHFFSRHKADIRRAKTAVQCLGEVATFQEQDNVMDYNSAWGPEELGEVLARAHQHAVQANKREHFVLGSGVQNQTWIYRPERDGTLFLVDNQPWMAKYGLARLPPSRAIPLDWAEKRTRDAANWPGGEPPAPDMDKLGDEPCPYIVDSHGDAPAPDDPVFDFRLSILHAEGVEDETIFDPDSRLQSVTIPSYLRDRQRQKMKLKGLGGKRRRHSVWIKRLHPKRAQALAQKWQDTLAEQGREALEDGLVPAAAVNKKAKQFQKLLKLAKSMLQPRILSGSAGKASKGPGHLARAGAQQRRKSGLPASHPPLPPADTEVTDHELHNKQVVIVAEACTWPQWGQEGTITKVTQTSEGQYTCTFLSDHLPAFYFRGPPECFQRCLGATYAEAAPEQLDYRTANAARNVHAASNLLIGNDDPATLPALRYGELQEIQAMGGALLEIEGRVPVDSSELILPAVALQLAWPGDLDRSQEEQLKRVRDRLKAARFIWVALWAPHHYTLFEASRPDPETSFTLKIWDSALGDHAPSALMSTTLSNRLFDVQPPPNDCSPKRSQVDPWSCGIHTATRLEQRRRLARGEKPRRAFTLSETIARANDFLSRVRAGARQPKKKSRGIYLPKAPPPKPGPTPPRNWDPANDPQTWEEAKIRAEICTKCRPRVAGPGAQRFKGCADPGCMGAWFELVRVRPTS